MLAFDETSTMIHLRLSESSRQRVQGDWDGVTPRKFELRGEEDGEEEDEGTALLDPEVEYKFGELFDVRLVREGVPK